MKEINRERFEAWLFSQPKDRQFEYQNIYGECAICAFVRETTSYKATGGASTVRLGLHGSSAPEIPTPAWLDRRTSGVASVEPLTIANMQQRYRELFPETEIVEESTCKSPQPVA